jgi:hypothetical protein
MPRYYEKAAACITQTAAEIICKAYYLVITTRTEATTALLPNCME